MPLPRREFRCEDCGHTKDVFYKSLCPKKQCCPKCEGDMWPYFGFNAASPALFAQPLISESAGVMPDQIREAEAHNRKMGDNVRYTADGAAIFESAQQKKAHLKNQGLIDKQSYTS